jgi:hypothetical protein
MSFKNIPIIVDPTLDPFVLELRGPNGQLIAIDARTQTIVQFPPYEKWEARMNGAHKREP